MDILYPHFAKGYIFFVAFLSEMLYDKKKEVIDLSMNRDLHQLLFLQVLKLLPLILLLLVLKLLPRILLLLVLKQLPQALLLLVL